RESNVVGRQLEVVADCGRRERICDVMTANERQLCLRLPPWRDESELGSAEITRLSKSARGDICRRVNSETDDPQILPPRAHRNHASVISIKNRAASRLDTFDQFCLCACYRILGPEELDVRGAHIADYTDFRRRDIRESRY